MAALQRYDAKLSFNQGEAMKKISILAAIFLPLTLTTVRLSLVPPMSLRGQHSLLTT